MLSRQTVSNLFKRDGPVDGKPAGPAATSSEGPLIPAIRPHAVRRTASVEVSWPEGLTGTANVAGLARDIRTGDPDEEPEVLCSAACTVGLSAARQIVAITTEPHDPRADGLVGLTAGRQSRTMITELFGEDDAKSSPLCSLLDDLTGLSLIAPWAWFVSQALTDKGEISLDPTELERQADEFGQPKHEVCLGHSIASRRNRVAADERNYTLGQPACDLTLPGDLRAAHDLRSQSGVTMRRARWLDLHREDDVLIVALGFQDSASAPHFRQRRTVHQYTGRITMQNGMLTDISVAPEVLPYRACFASPQNLSLLRSVPVSDLHKQVPRILAKALGCTHLNDMLRSLSSIPALERMLVPQI